MKTLEEKIYFGYNAIKVAAVKSNNLWGAICKIEDEEIMTLSPVFTTQQSAEEAAKEVCNTIFEIQKQEMKRMLQERFKQKLLSISDNQSN